MKVKNIIMSIISFILSLVLLFFFYYIYKLNMIPNKILILVYGIMFVIQVVGIFLLYRKVVCNVIGIILLLLNFGVCTFGIINIKNINDTMSSIEETSEKEFYDLIVTSKGVYKDVKSLEGKTVGVLESTSENYDLSIKELNKKVKVNIKSYTDVNLMFNDLKEGKIDAILINTNNRALLEENIKGFKESITVLDTISIKIVKEKIEFNKKHEPFNVIVSGIDTYGSINYVSRSDVNIVMSVNPRVNKIMLTHIPRDMHVQLHGRKGLKDKLTHSGIYGVDMTRNTIADFLNISIPYYVRVNFSSVEEIVDAIGGIDIDNEYEFSEYGTTFPKGKLHLNGKKALIYARLRHTLPRGDVDRGIHQEVILDAIIQKVSTSKEILKNYN